MYEWRSINSAPRDGTVIEIKNDWSPIAPWFGLFHWADGKGGYKWRRADNEPSNIYNGPHLSWRQYNGKVGDYVDPTRGAQFSERYWQSYRVA